MPAFTVSFCAVIAAVYILDTFFLIPKGAAVSPKEKLLTGHNKGNERKLQNEEINKTAYGNNAYFIHFLFVVFCGSFSGDERYENDPKQQRRHFQTL